MQATFYVFPKRTNSTKRPTSGTPYSIEVKSPCNIINPEIKIATNANPTGYNYCHIPTWGRYYWVKNWTFSDGLWTGSLVVDALASYRDQIGSATEYVLRSSAQYNGNIVDTLYPTTAEYTSAQNPCTKIFGDDVNQGSYVVSVICSGYVGFGCTTYWSMSNAAFREFRKALLSNTDYLGMDAEEISEGLTKALFNPYQYLVSCMWFPFDAPSDPALSTSSLTVGWWDITLGDSFQAGIVNSGFDTKTFVDAVAIPKHPQASDRGAYVNMTPYSTYILYYPPFGEIQIDTTKVVNSDALHLKTVIDMYSGMGYLYVSADANFTKIIAVRSAQVGVTVSLAQIANQTLDSVGDVVSAAANGLYGFAKGVADFFAGNTDAGGVLNAVGDAAEKSITTAQYKGTAGAVSVYTAPGYLQAYFQRIADDNNEDHGRPLCRRVQLSSIPGYIMVDDPDISLPATAAEIDSVKSYLKNGFFFE